MMSYKFKRRAFLGAIGGGVGLKVMFRNLELSAQAATSPPRLLVTHWPVGIVAGQNEALWRPTSGSVGGSPGLAPFASLGADMTVLRGINMTSYGRGGCAGSHEGGTPLMTTAADLLACRAVSPEGDDGTASGPSADQVLLANVPALRASMGGAGYANSISDSRVDLQEVGAQCLSYGTTKQSVQVRGGGTVMQATPLMPILSPLQQYTTLFGNFVPPSCGTGGTGGTAGMAGMGGTAGKGASNVASEMLRQLAMKKSVLDFALEEINQMRTLAPAGAQARLDIHAQAIRDMESSIQSSINNIGPAPMGGSAGAMSGAAGVAGTGSTNCNMQCMAKPMPPPNVTGSSGSPGLQYGGGNDVGKSDDGPIHQQVSELHLDVLRAAFTCDLIRVGSMQYSPGTNHVSFKGQYPGNATGIFQHHPVSHRIGTGETIGSATVGGLNANAGFLYNIQLWYFTRHAEALAKWKTQLDAFGNSLLDYTVVPYVTEVQATGHEFTNMPAMIIGGKRLGFIHNKYVTGNWTPRQYWGTVGQAFGYTNMDVPIGAPIAGIWTAPV
jgi:hypothetical protein